MKSRKKFRNGNGEIFEGEKVIGIAENIGHVEGELCYLDDQFFIKVDQSEISIGNDGVFAHTVQRKGKDFIVR